MSCNITRWKTKRLENLRVPLVAFYPIESPSWHPERTNEDDGTVTLRGAEGGVIHGRLTKDILHVDRFEVYGERSGNYLEEVLKPALELSDGVLLARLVWDGGDSITSFEVREGRVRERPVEL